MRCFWMLAKKPSKGENIEVGKVYKGAQEMLKCAGRGCWSDVNFGPDVMRGSTLPILDSTIFDLRHITGTSK
jgi:hypothetical protein